MCLVVHRDTKHISLHNPKFKPHRYDRIRKKVVRFDLTTHLSLDRFGIYTMTRNGSALPDGVSIWAPSGVSVGHILNLVK